MAGDAEYKQLLDVSRTLSEVVSELKKTNKDLASISKVVSKDLPKSLDQISESQKKSDEKIEKIAKDNKKETTAPAKKAEDDYAEILKRIGVSGDLSKKLAQLEEDQYKKLKESQAKGALKKGGKVTEPGNYLVGENGPEIIDVPGGSKVIPLDVSDLIDGLNTIPQIKNLIKDGVLKVEPQGGDNILIGDGGKYSIERIKANIQGEIAENTVLGLDTKVDSDRLSVLDSLNKKIAGGDKAGSGGEKTADSAISGKGGVENMKLEDFYPSKSEIDAHIASLIKLDPGLAGDTEGIAYETDRFMSEEADRRFAEARKKSGSAAAVSTASPELTKKSSGEKSLFGKEKNRGEKNPLSGASSKKGGGEEKQRESGKGLEKIKSGLSKGLGGISKISESKFGSLLGAAADKKLFGGTSVTSKLVSGVTKTASGLLSKGGAGGDTKKTEPKREQAKPALSIQNKKSEPAALSSTSTPATPPPAQSPAPSNTKQETPSSSSKSSPGKGESDSSNGSPLGSSSTDLAEIKALLANISRSLSGPLNVYNPDPFRPDSKRI